MDADAGFGAFRLGRSFEGGDHGIVVEGVVMVEEDVFDAGGLAFFQGPTPSGVAPAMAREAAFIFAFVFFVGVLRVVEHEVGAGDEFLDVGVEVAEVFGVGGEGEGADGVVGEVFFDAVAEAAAGVVEAVALDAEKAGFAFEFDGGVFFEVAEVHFGGHVLELDGEVEVFLLAAEGFFKDAADEALGGGEFGSPEVEAVAFAEGGDEKGEALDVVPVDVAEDEGGVDGRAAAGQFEAQEAEAGTAIHDEEGVFGFDGDAGGVASVFGGDEGRGAGCGNAAASAPKSNFQAGSLS